MTEEKDDEYIEEVDDSRDNLVRRRVEEQTALKAFRFTREEQSQFAIDMGNGKEVKDKRPLRSTKTEVEEGANPTRKINFTQPGAPVSGPGLTPPSPPTAMKSKQEQAANSDMALQPGNRPVFHSSPQPPVPPTTPLAQGVQSQSTVPGAHKPVKLTVYLQARLQQQSELFGVTVRPEPDGMEYVRNVNGREMSLFTQPATDKGLVIAEELLKKAIADSQNLLSAKFGITFSSVDELIDESSASKSKDNKAVFGRQPNFIELDALGEALSVSDPAHRTADRQPLRIAFIDADRNGRNVVSFSADDSGSFRIYVFPDTATVGQNMVHKVARFFIEILAHNTVLKTGNAETQSISGLTQAIAALRSGPAERKQLLKENRPLYSKAKEIDQWEINREYGLQRDGTEQKLRLPNGKLVHNKREMADEVQRFEESG